LSVQEYPQGAYAGLSYDYLGKAFEKTGDIKQAIESYRKLLELNPEDSAAAEALKALENK